MPAFMRFQFWLWEKVVGVVDSFLAFLPGPVFAMASVCAPAVHDGIIYAPPHLAVNGCAFLWDESGYVHSNLYGSFHASSV